MSTLLIGSSVWKELSYKAKGFTFRVMEILDALRLSVPKFGVFGLKNLTI